MKKLIFAIGLVAVLFLLSGCAQNQNGNNPNQQGNPRFNRDWNGRGPPGDFNGPRDFNGIPRDTNFDFAKPLLNLPREATLNDIKQALGLPVDSTEQLVFMTIREKFPDNFPMPGRNNNGNNQ